MPSNPLLSIITINYNNAAGLEKTLVSVNAQTNKEFEHIIVDGGSTDGSVDEIKKYDDGSVQRTWVSEKDSGIYNAMNKGIRMAHGQYVQFLNSGDYLISSDVVETVYTALKAKNLPQIMYCNLIALTKKGRLQRSKNQQGAHVTPWVLYAGSLPHSSAFFQRELFFKYGMYDEEMKIVSDWEWYFDVIYNHGLQPSYADVDVSCFNLSGISETNHELNAKERRIVIERIIPQQCLQDYDKFKPSIINQAKINKYSFIAMLQRLLLLMVDVCDKIKLRIDNIAIWREFKKKGIVIR